MSKQMIFKELGIYLRNAREVRSITQREASNYLKLSSAQFISNIERGDAMPPMKTLRKLIKFYKLDPEEVIAVLLGLYHQYLRRTFML